jgi:MFS family permease
MNLSDDQPHAAPGRSNREQFERNVDLYPWYMALYHAFFWMPVFFLYFSEYLTVSGVLQLEAIYYVAVVLTEVPSGWASDRLGRRYTLIIGASSLLAGYTILFVAGWGLSGAFWAFALGQVCLATGIACHSGTATSLHYESLTAVGRADAYDDREAMVARVTRASTAAAALIGGTLTLWALSFVYVASAICAVGLVALAVAFAPPSTLSNTHDTDDAPDAIGYTDQSLFRQIRESIGFLDDPILRWLFGFAVSMTVLLHIPYEFYQPYLELLSVAWTDDAQWAGLAAGTHMAIATGLGAWAAGYSIEIRNAYGTRTTLLATVIGQVMLIGSLGLILHPVIAVIILARSLPSALSKAPLNAAVTPRIPDSHRATYISVQSLAGRLAFALSLLGLSWIAEVRPRPDAPPSWPALSELLIVSTAIGIGALIILAWTGPDDLEPPT